MNWFTREQERRLRQIAAVCPQPVAASVSSCLRSRSAEAVIDATLKAAEVLTRYAAVVALVSFASRENRTAALPFDASTLAGPISFGSFLEVVTNLASSPDDHPLKSQFAKGFVVKKGKQQRRAAKAHDALKDLLELRNALGHDLSTLGHAGAETLLHKKNPVGALLDAAEGLGGILNLPLFVIEEQKLAGGVVSGRRLLLMGDSADPEPEWIELTNGIYDVHAPYLGVPGGLIRLAPLMTWAIAPERMNYRIFLLDAVETSSARFKAVDAMPRVVQSDERGRITQFLRDPEARVERIDLATEQDFLSEWLTRRKTIVDLGEQHTRSIPWADLDSATMQWFAQRLEPEASRAPRAVILERLLDGRDSLDVRECEQLLMLFGREKSIRSMIRREVMDLRARRCDEGRWDERCESHRNVIECLRQAVEFFSRHIGAKGMTFEGLGSTSGTADYIAMREALVNFFIHQDYADASAAAQVDITSDRAVIFNPGHAMVSAESLVEGGKSQARNPVIARGLRLIGFAELAGSGLRELQRLWRHARRRPPRMESDERTNTFTLILDWRDIPNAYNEFWKETLGVQLSDDEACVLNLALDPAGISMEEAASATSGRLEDARQIIDRLVKQVLIEESADRFHVKEYLRDVAK